jgi:hypothetical protein
MSFAGKWLELEMVMSSKVESMQKKSIACFLSSVEYRPKEKECKRMTSWWGKEKPAGASEDKRRGQ